MFPEILVAVAAILIGDAPACDRSRAMAVGKERAEREGVSGPALESSIGGPYDWSTFSAEHPTFAKSMGETLSLFLEQHRFFFVHLTPKLDPRVIACAR